jgi:hypothetical protein
LQQAGIDGFIMQAKLVRGNRKGKEMSDGVPLFRKERECEQGIPAG